MLFGGLFIGSILSSFFGRATGALLGGIGSGFVASIVLGFGIGALIIGFFSIFSP